MRWLRKHLMSLSDNGIIDRHGTKVKIWPDGTITRADTDLTLCRSMSVKETVKALKLTEKDYDLAKKLS